MKRVFATENRNLRRSWDRYTQDHLQSYLVVDVEDPRINCQSILSRALIIDSVWPGAFTGLIDAELRFGSVLTWLLNQLKQGVYCYDLLDSIELNNSTSCPLFVRETYQWLQSDICQINDYITTALIDVHSDDPQQFLYGGALDTYTDIWQTILDTKQATPMRILEPACGSANDYRFMDQRGLSRFVTYTGIDIATKNIANAGRQFPQADFRVNSLLDSDFANESYDYVLVHDLFEHLSADAMQHALAEILRIARHQAWLHFFNVNHCHDHLIRPVEHYHWNKLSLDRLCDTITALGAEVEVISVSGLLQGKFDGYEHYNPGAYTLLVTKR